MLSHEYCTPLSLTPCLIFKPVWDGFFCLFVGFFNGNLAAPQGHSDILGIIEP